jgi:hypothetical protein
MIEWMQNLETLDDAKDYHLANKSLREAIQKNKPEFHAQYNAALEIIKKEKRGQ